MINGLKYILFLMCLFVLGGCFSAKERVVYIPQRCDIIYPAYPLPRGNAVENLKELAIYTEKLECSLDFCINGENLIPNCKIER